MSECATGNYLVPEASLNRSSSEPDIFAYGSQNFRQRTCSNSSSYGSLQRVRKASKVSGNVDKTVPSKTEVNELMDSVEHSGYDYSERK